MKHILSTVFILLLSKNSIAQSDTIFQPGMVNISTFVIDYTTLAFEKFSADHYSCSNCPVNQFPLGINYLSPGDFGSIEFVLQPSNEPFFFGGIVWMGQGQISHPTLDSPNSSLFNNQGTAQTVQSSTLYINEIGNLTADPVFIQQAQLAWDVISSFNLTHQYGQHGYNSAIYLYTPTVGFTDWSVAKWIVVLYTNTQENAAVEIPKNNGLNLYPNPAYNVLNWSKEMDVARIEFWSISNTLIKDEIVGNENSYLLSNDMDSGIYVVKLFDDKNQNIGNTRVTLFRE